MPAKEVPVQLGLDEHMPIYEIPAPYRRVSTLPELEALVSRLRRASLVAVDTETRPRARHLPLDGRTRRYHALTAGLNELIGISLSFRAPGGAPEGEHVYLPVRHRASTKQLSLEHVRAHLGPVLADPAIEKVFHHAKFDLSVLRADGLVVHPLPHDTLLLASLLDLYALPRVDEPGPAALRHERYTRERPSLALKELARRHVNAGAAEHEAALHAFRERLARTTRRHRDDVGFDEVPVDLMVPYAASDTRWTLLLFELLSAFADTRTTRLYETERRLIPVLAEMEWHGARVDRDFLERSTAEHAREREAALSSVRTFAGDPALDPDAPARLVAAFQRAGIVLGERTGSGQRGRHAGALGLVAGIPRERARAYVEALVTWLAPAQEGADLLRAHRCLVAVLYLTDSQLDGLHVLASDCHDGLTQTRNRHRNGKAGQEEGELRTRHLQFPCERVIRQEQSIEELIGHLGASPHQISDVPPSRALDVVRQPEVPQVATAASPRCWCFESHSMSTAPSASARVNVRPPRTNTV